MRIVVLDGHTLNPGDNPWDDVACLGSLVVHERTGPDQILGRASGADIILTNKTPMSAQTIEQLPGLRFISVLATGYNVVDIRAAAVRGIPVSNVPVYGTDSVAQFVFAQLLNLAVGVAYHSDQVRARHWSRCEDFCFWDFGLMELAGKRIGIVGFGRIGRRVAELAHAFGMKVSAATPNKNDAPAYPGFSWMESGELFSECDVVTLHCPLTGENAGMVDAETLALMKPSAYLINTSRGGLVDEAALAAALDSGQLAGAAVDVVSTEPIDSSNPLLVSRNCLITPHIAWATVEARQRLMRATSENIKAFLDGEPINVVNA